MNTSVSVVLLANELLNNLHGWISECCHWVAALMRFSREKMYNISPGKKVLVMTRWLAVLHVGRKARFQ